MRRASVVKHVLLALVVVVGARTAVAQGTVQPTSLTVNAADCASSTGTTIQWRVTGLTDAYFLSVRLEERPVGSSVCPEFGIQTPLFIVEPFGQDLVSPTSGTLYVEAEYNGKELLGPLCEDAVRREAVLCLYGSSTTNAPASDVDIDLVLPPLVVSLDTDVPDAPIISSLTGSDQKLTAQLGGIDTSAGDTYSFLVQYRACPGNDDEDAGVTDGGATDAGTLVAAADSLCDATADYRQTTVTTAPAVLTGLENGRTYEVRVALRDDFENEGPPSAAMLGTPLDEHSPLSLYDGTPNPFSIEGPSCSSVLPLGPLSLLSLSLALRRRRGGRP